MAASAALSGPQDVVKKTASIYARRRDILVDELARQGWKVEKPKASMFIWAELPGAYRSSEDFAGELIRKTGVVVIPGTAFGSHGEGFVRIALVQDEKKLQEAGHRIGEFLRGR